MTWPVLAQKDSQRLVTWASQMARAGVRCYIPHFAFSPLGALGVAELISNGTGLLNTTGWTAGGSATLSVNNGQLEVANGAASAGNASTPITCVIGQTYVVAAILTAGSTGTANVLIGTTAGGSQVSSTAVTPGYIFIVFTATATTHYVGLQTNTAVSGDYTFWARISATQGALVNGANQTGNSLTINGLPASLTNAIAAGDYLQLATGQVVRAVMDASTGVGGAFSTTVFIEPAIRTSPANASGIRLLSPEVPFAFPKANSSQTFQAPRIGSLSISLVEDINLG